MNYINVQLQIRIIIKLKKNREIKIFINLGLAIWKSHQDQVFELAGWIQIPNFSYFKIWFHVKKPRECHQMFSREKNPREPSNIFTFKNPREPRNFCRYLIHQIEKQWKNKVFQIN